jgi:uncharacterized membrane protein YeaQ/YmgE (transglycosylase-associated protein family)
MGFFELACLLLGAICGNLAPALVPPVNLGLIWNTALGMVGAAVYAIVLPLLELPTVSYWLYDYLAAGLAGFALVFVLGGVVEFLYSRR